MKTLVILAVLLAACSTPTARPSPAVAASPKAPSAPLAGPPATQAPPPALPAPSAPAAVDPALATLGFAGPPAAPTPAATKALAAATKALAKHDLATAETQLAGSLAASPDLAEARYRLAVVHALRGDHAAARTELAQLAAEDLPAFANRIAADPDLATFRANPDGAALRAQIAELDGKWAAAIAHGVPTLLFAGDHGSQEILMPRILRPGVWVAEVHRFFALAPPVDNTIDGFVDLSHQQVVVVTMDIADCKSDFCPRIERVGVELWALGSPARRVATWSGRGELMHDATLQLVGGGVRLQYGDCNMKSCRSDWLRIDATGAHRDADQHQLADAITLVVDYRGGALILPLAGCAVTGDRLVSGTASVELDRWHRSADIHDLVAAGSQVVVASTVDRCECGNGFEGQIYVHDVARVDLATGKAQSVAHGKLSATLVPGRDGSVYLQLADRVTRYATVDAVGGTGEPLPAGVLLVPPPGGRLCCSL